MKLSLLTALVFPLLAQVPMQTQTAPRGRIEGVVLESGSVSPQPIAGARITVTKVNSATGEGIIVAGRAAGTSLTTGGNTPFPGMQTGGNQLAQGGPRLLETTFPRVQMRLVNRGLEDYLGTSPSGQSAAADGSFSMTGVLPGTYRVIVAPTQDFYVRELRYDRADALRSPIEVSRRNSDSGTLEVIISRNVGQLDGVVQDDRAQPVPGVQAVLIPDARDRTELYKTATTDQTGHFIMRGITPGDYKLFAWEALENFGYFDPDVMRRSENFGKAIQVTESSRLGADLKIIPAGQ